MNGTMRLLGSMLAAVLAVTVLTPAAAQAGPDGRVTKYALVKHTKKTDVTDFKHRLGVCVAKSNGVKCKISKGRTATRSISTDFGLSKGWVAGKLNISASSSQTITVGCSTVTLKKGQKLEAFPVGSKHKYKIRKQVVKAKKVLSTTYSAYKTTYNPYKTGISCRIS